MAEIPRKHTHWRTQLLQTDDAFLAKDKTVPSDTYIVQSHKCKNFIATIVNMECAVPCKFWLATEDVPHLPSSHPHSLSIHSGNKTLFIVLLLVYYL